MSPPSEIRLDDRILFMLNAAQHKMEKFANNELKNAAGISLVQSGCLAYLYSHNGCQLKELSAGLMLNNSAITGLIDRMVRADLVDKRTCGIDGRAYRVYLTDKGVDAWKKSLIMLEEFNVLFSEEFNLEERQIIVRFLQFFSRFE